MVCYLHRHDLVLLIDFIMSHVDHLRQDVDTSIIFRQVGCYTSNLFTSLLFDLRHI